MSSIAIEEKRQLAYGAKKINKFTTAVRPLDNTGLEVGDVFQIPENYTVFERMFGTNKAQYILVEVGTDNAKPFYPSTFSKSRRVYNEDGTPTTERVTVKGTAVDEFQKYGDVNTAMESMKGKWIKVSDMEEVRTVQFGTTNLTYAQIPTLDFTTAPNQADKK
ncbi:MAG: hypothetical protein ACOYJE_00485 [Bacteroidaceae bacterium]|jgi:hypothetical protein